MTVCQMMTGSGGWPLTILMTPDKRPFFAATYLPKSGRFGRTGLMELIPRVAELWQQRRADVLDSADKIASALRQTTEREQGAELGEETLRRAYAQLAARFDADHGGFGTAPKFPTPHNLSFLLRHGRRSGLGRAVEMVERTLQAMRLGGIYDHVGFGFHRYATDAEWLVPHFEKMLYDQALLAIAYTEAWQATGKPRPTSASTTPASARPPTRRRCSNCSRRTERKARPSKHLGMAPWRGSCPRFDTAARLGYNKRSPGTVRKP